jgi:polyisoprenoid-binding protein YceI
LSQTGTEARNATHYDRFAAAAADGESGSYAFDLPHSVIGFKVKHNGLIEIPGYFRDFTGKVDYNAADVAKSRVEFNAKVSSIDTGVMNRDNHLRSKDFFEVEKFPDITPARMGITATTTLNRRDYGINYGGNLPSGIAAISDTVTVNLEIEATMKKDPGAAIKATQAL